MKHVGFFYGETTEHPQLLGRLTIQQKELMDWGLGMHKWNLATINKHLWHAYNKKDSLWLKSIHHYNLRKSSIWKCKPKNDYSWY